MQPYIFILILAVFAFQSKAQVDYLTPKTAPKKTQEAYKKAYAYVQQNELDLAIQSFQKLIKKTPEFINAYIQLGYLYERLQQNDKALFSFKQSLEIAPDYHPKVHMAIARIAMKNKDYSLVEKHLTTFLAFKNQHPNLIKIAKKRLADALFRPQALQNPVPFSPQNLGSNINTAQREYFPSISLDNQLVYTVQFGQGNQAQEDLYISSYDKGTWQKGRGIDQVNTSENEGAQTISADGNFLVFTVCNRPEDYGSCDLYYAQKIEGQWTKPRNIGPPINSSQWESQPSIASNGKALYFVRGAARGQGHKDIYVSKRQKDGTWGEPSNLEAINTLDNESSPCLHPDGKTLYFSSNGWPGMGGYDLYVSRKEGGIWTKPQNLGYPINTKEQEEAIAVNRIGSIAYLASDRSGGFGSLDIYGFELPDFARPIPVSYVKGITRHAIDKNPLAASVEIIDLKTQKVHASLTTDKDGTFMIAMPLGAYALNVSKQGFLFYSANYNLTDANSLDKAYQLEALLQPILLKESDSISNIREPIVLENVFFKTGSFVLESDSRVELDKLYTLLKKYPSIHILISGHTDNVGQDNDNRSLSDNRARAVVDYLILKGIASDRLSFKGFGASQPRFSNKTEAGRAGNRRTTFQMLK